MLSIDELKAIEKRVTKVRAQDWILGDWWSRCHLSHQPHDVKSCKYEPDFHEGNNIVLPDKAVTILNNDTDWGDAMTKDGVKFALQAGKDILALLSHIKELEAKLIELGNQRPPD